MESKEINRIQDIVEKLEEYNVTRDELESEKAELNVEIRNLNREQAFLKKALTAKLSSKVVNSPRLLGLKIKKLCDEVEAIEAEIQLNEDNGWISIKESNPLHKYRIKENNVWSD